MRVLYRFLALAMGIAFCCLAISTSAQKTDPLGSELFLTVGGEVTQPLKLTRADLSDL